MFPLRDIKIYCEHKKLGGGLNRRGRGEVGAA